MGKFKEFLNSKNRVITRGPLMACLFFATAVTPGCNTIVENAVRASVSQQQSKPSEVESLSFVRDRLRNILNTQYDPDFWRDLDMAILMRTNQPVANQCINCFTPGEIEVKNSGNSTTYTAKIDRLLYFGNVGTESYTVKSVPKDLEGKNALFIAPSDSFYLYWLVEKNSAGQVISERFTSAFSQDRPLLGKFHAGTVIPVDDLERMTTGLYAEVPKKWEEIKNWGIKGTIDTGSVIKRYVSSTNGLTELNLTYLIP